MMDECNLSTECNADAFQKAMYNRTCSTVASTRDSSAVRSLAFSDVHTPMECIDSTSMSSSDSESIPPERNAYVENEEIYAIQTCYNSLNFPRLSKAERPRSASLSHPSSGGGGDDDDDRGTRSCLMWKFNFGRRGGKCPRYRKMALEEYEKVEQEERVWNFSTRRREVLTETVPEHERTSVMLRCIPKEYTRDDILDVIAHHGFINDINFMYLPANFKRPKDAGNGNYCFLNFRFPEDAAEFKSVFTGLVLSDASPEEKCGVEWRNPIQGFASHFDRYQNSFRTRDPNLSYFRPTLMRNGVPVPFPEPWEKVNECQKFQKKLAAGRMQIRNSHKYRQW